MLLEVEVVQQTGDEPEVEGGDEPIGERAHLAGERECAPEVGLGLLGVDLETELHDDHAEVLRGGGLDGFYAFHALYGALHGLGHLFVHHVRASPRDRRRDDDEREVYVGQQLLVQARRRVDAARYQQDGGEDDDGLVLQAPADYSLH